MQTLLAIVLIAVMGYVIWRWTIYGRMARGLFGGGARQAREMRTLMQMNAMARQMEQSLPPTLLEWGHAWLAAWGNAAPDAMLMRGADTRGPVSEHYREIWEGYLGTLSAADFIRGRWSDITAACAAQPRCPDCGTWRGNHASYCSRKDWQPVTT
jgi:hypothetical protein